MKCMNCGFEVSKTTKDRSNPQNRYFHGKVIPIIAYHTGYTQDEVKAVLKWKFNVKQTSALTTFEFEQFMSNIRQWASAELGCWIPEPNENMVGV